MYSLTFAKYPALKIGQYPLFYRVRVTSTQPIVEKVENRLNSFLYVQDIKPQQSGQQV